MPADFATYTIPAPEYGHIDKEYRELFTSLDAAANGNDAIAVVEKWDALRRRVYTWTALVGIRFRQDTRNEQYKKDREYCDELEPRLTNLAVQMKRRLMDSPHRGDLERKFGAHAFKLWECDVAAFDPAIESNLVEEAKLAAAYAELLASGKFEFGGETLTLSQMMKFEEDADRSVRHDAAALRWRWFAENRDQFDTIFDKQVRLRHTMAEKLGFSNFVEVGYQRMKRIGYDKSDVERFRAQVREHVVPLATEMRRQQARKLGVDPLMAWDQAIHDPAGNPEPGGNADWMIERAQAMFNELGGGIDVLFARMRTQNLMDLKSREGKSAGGFCDLLPGFDMPFIYANSDGTMSDVTTFTHEMGHAFQCYSSLDQPLFEYVMATEDSCEIHSMSLEFLTWPQMSCFFGDDADRYCRMHLAKLLQFFPYGVAVDHFQHLVYENPHSTPDERALMWQQMEQMYLPWLRWGDLQHPASGRRWQAQLHIYVHPFYYIDYTLALTCALQFWLLAAENREAAMARYVRLCHRGGSAAFGDLVRSAGLVSPFEEGCLAGAVQHARRELG